MRERTSNLYDTVGHRTRPEGAPLVEGVAPDGEGADADEVDDLLREQLQNGYRVTNIPEAWRFVWQVADRSGSGYTPTFGHVGDPVSDVIDLDVDDVKDFTDDPVPETVQRDHGIQVVSQAAAQTGNNVGMAGVSDAEVIVAQFINGNYDRSHPVRVGKAIKWLVDHSADVDVINVSWSFSRAFYTELYSAIRYAYENGVVVVTSAGNKATNRPSRQYPGAFDLPNLITVGATRGNDDTLAPFSNFGEFVDIAAPGFRLPGYIYDHLFRDENDNPDRPWELVFTFGTSFSAPLVAGVLLLMLRTNPDLRDRPALLKRLLMGTAQDMGLTGPLRNGAGAGRVDTLAAVKAAANPLSHLGYDGADTVGPSLSGANTPGTFEVYTDADGAYRWRLTAANGRIVADSGQGYANLRAEHGGALNGVRNLRSAFDRDTAGQHRVEIYEDAAGEYRWRYVHRNGNLIADSGEGYDGRYECERAALTAMVYATHPRTEVNTDAAE